MRTRRLYEHFCVCPLLKPPRGAIAASAALYRPHSALYVAIAAMLAVARRSPAPWPLLLRPLRRALSRANGCYRSCLPTPVLRMVAFAPHAAPGRLRGISWAALAPLIAPAGRGHERAAPKPPWSVRGAHGGRRPSRSYARPTSPGEVDSGAGIAALRGLGLKNAVHALPDGGNVVVDAPPSSAT